MCQSKHTLPSDVILRRTTFTQPILPPSGPIMSHDSLLILWRHINPLPTYLFNRWDNCVRPTGVNLWHNGSTKPTISQYFSM